MEETQAMRKRGWKAFFSPWGCAGMGMGLTDLTGEEVPKGTISKE